MMLTLAVFSFLPLTKLRAGPQMPTTGKKKRVNEIFPRERERERDMRIQQSKIELGSSEFREAKVKEMQQSSVVFS